MTASRACGSRSAVADGEAGLVSFLRRPPWDRIVFDTEQSRQAARQQLLLLLNPRRSRSIFPRQAACELRNAPKQRPKRSWSPVLLAFHAELFRLEAPGFLAKSDVHSFFFREFECQVPPPSVGWQKPYASRCCRGLAGEQLFSESRKQCLSWLQPSQATPVVHAADIAERKDAMPAGFKRRLEVVWNRTACGHYDRSGPIQLCQDLQRDTAIGPGIMRTIGISIRCASQFSEDTRRRPEKGSRSLWQDNPMRSDKLPLPATPLRAGRTTPAGRS